MFKGMKDPEREVIKTTIPREEKRAPGMPDEDFRCVLLDKKNSGMISWIVSETRELQKRSKITTISSVFKK